MPKNSDKAGCMEVLVAELRLKQEALDAAQSSEQTLLDKSTRYKRRAKDAELKLKHLEFELVELRAQMQEQKSSHQGGGRKAKYRQELADAVAAKEEAERECEALRVELARAKKQLKKTQQIDESTQESNNLQEQLDASEQREVTADRGKPPREPNVENAIDDQISRALSGFPVVKDLPAGKLRPLGNDLRAVIAKLSKETMDILRAQWKYHSFKESQILFADNHQHGYTLSPKTRLRPRDDAHDDEWRTSRALHMYSERPFEAFHLKAGSWHYIGTYRAFFICAAPWNSLSRWSYPDVLHLIRGTIVGPQRHDKEIFDRVHEEYAAGRIVAAYVGMQCVGFDHGLYRELCEAASKLDAAQPTASMDVKKRSQSPPDTTEGQNKRRRVQTSSSSVKPEATRVPIPC